MYILIKSALSANCSSVKPRPSNSSRRAGSILSRFGFGAGARAAGAAGIIDSLAGIIDCIVPCCVPEEERWTCSKFPRPPSRLRFPVLWVGSTDATGALTFIALLNGFLLVFLCAFFSRSSIFFLNCLASLSSAKDNPARQFSNSKVWK